MNQKDKFFLNFWLIFLNTRMTSLEYRVSSCADGFSV